MHPPYFPKEVTKLCLTRPAQLRSLCSEPTSPQPQPNPQGCPCPKHVCAARSEPSYLINRNYWKSTIRVLGKTHFMCSQATAATHIGVGPYDLQTGTVRSAVS